MNVKARLMESEDIRRALVRLSHQIIEKNHGAEGLCLIGIRTRGVPLAERIASNIRQYEGVSVPVGALDVTHFRDDIDRTAAGQTDTSSIGFDITAKSIVLVDDVLYTCRTARAAMDAVMKLGRPARIQLAALIDRGHSELPIKANYIGKSIPTSHAETVCVRLAETDGVSEVVLLG